ncbi:MAG: formylglycine-generating enzyme family protein, partial [Verrucomicrobiota bacterium]
MKLRLISMIILLSAGVMGLSAEENKARAIVSTTQTPPALKRFTNSIGMELVGIPSGSYLCYGREIKPAFLFPKPKGFTVKIEREFYLGVTEVTQAQYRKVMGANPSAGKSSKYCPVNRVSWNDALEFCRKLSEMPAEKAAGRAYSLPTEREWQYAARAGSEFLFPYGNDDEMRVSEVAVCRDIYANALPKGVQPVGKKNPNAWG